MPDASLRPLLHPHLHPWRRPSGLRVVEKSNWTGFGVVFKRSNLKDAISRPEAAKTGVYVLVGSSDESTVPMIYVGEGDPPVPHIASKRLDFCGGDRSSVRIARIFPGLCFWVAVYRCGGDTGAIRKRPGTLEG